MEGACASCDLWETTMEEGRKETRFTGRSGDTRTLPLTQSVPCYLPIPNPNHMGVGLGNELGYPTTSLHFFMMDTINYLALEAFIILGNPVHHNPLFRVQVCWWFYQTVDYIVLFNVTAMPQLLSCGNFFFRAQSYLFSDIFFFYDLPLLFL